jgi:methylated-DNA-[protein]-cysteine S-methyltransferase
MAMAAATIMATARAGTRALMATADATTVGERLGFRRYVSKRLASPVGLLTLVATDAAVAAILWENDREQRVRLTIDGESPDHPVLLEAGRQLEEYFAGRRQHFDLALDAPGTPFQQQVWAALRTIPYGETRSYSQIAGQIGRPRAVRAVGAANGRNPISIVTPCHRVIGAGGALTGFAGGLEVKARLLDFEAGRLDGFHLVARRPA